ncbi:MAG: hemolysin family protein [Bacteroidota bacterium]
MLTELLLVLLLICISGIFVLAEIALISSRKARLEKEAKQGRLGAKVALKLMEKPQQFLSVVQIYITLVSFIAATYGGTAIAHHLTEYFKNIESLKNYADFLGIATIVSLTTYFSLLLGELVPKTLGINYPERVAMFFAPIINVLGWVARPIAWFLQFSTKVVLKIMMIKTNVNRSVTEEELHHMIEQGSEHGILEKQESDMMRGIIRIGDRKVNSLMTHRSEIIWVDEKISEEDLLKKLSESVHSNFPVCNGELDNVVGMVSIKDIFTQFAEKKKMDVKTIMIPPMFFPETMPALELLETFKKTHTHTGLIVNEYGSLEGIVSLHDLLESIVGELPIDATDDEQMFVVRKDGSWLIDGLMQIDQCMELVGLEDITDKDKGAYTTVGGFVMHHLGRIPKAADGFDFKNFHFEVMDMDGHRVDKLLIKSIEAPQ